jgi:hypothetical protein
VGKLHRGAAKQVLSDGAAVASLADDEQISFLLIGRFEHGIDRIARQQLSPEGYACVSKRRCPEALEKFASLALDLLEVDLRDRHEPFPDFRDDVDHDDVKVCVLRKLDAPSDRMMRRVRAVRSYNDSSPTRHIALGYGLGSSTGTVGFCWRLNDPPA